jgi:hypothetical protein
MSESESQHYCKNNFNAPWLGMTNALQTIELDAKARALVKAYVDRGDGDWKQSCADSGKYAIKELDSVAERASQSPAMLAAVHVEIGRRLVAGAPLALKTLQDLCNLQQTDTATLRIKLDAAKTLLDRAGHIAPKARDSGDGATKQTHEMSLDELRDRRAALEREIQARAVPVNAQQGADIETQAIDLLE